MLSETHVHFDVANTDVVVPRHIPGAQEYSLLSLKSAYRAPPEGTVILHTVILALDQYITAVS